MEEAVASAKAILSEPLGCASAYCELYADQLDGFIGHINDALAHVRELMRPLEAEVSQQSNQTEEGRKKSHKVPTLLYIHPFFKDSSGMSAPQNRDSLAKAASGEFDALASPSKRWTQAELDRLLAAVRSDIVRLETHTNRHKLELLSEKVDSAAKALNVAAQENLAARMDEIEEEMKATKASLSNIVGSFNRYDDIDWLKIANEDFTGTRSPRELRLKWELEVSPVWRHDEKWAPQEKDRLKELVARADSVRAGDWDRVARKLGTRRSGWAVFEKYQSCLNQALITGPWAAEEDEQLLNIVEQVRLGDVIPWEQVAYAMQGRTRAQVQARWVRTLDPQVKRGRWSEDEDFILIVAIHKVGPRDWAKVAAQVPCRTDTQCRERWLSFLSEGVEYGAWSPEEDDILREGVGVFGVGSWARCAKLLPGRTGGMVKVRWQRLASLKELMRDAIAKSVAAAEQPPTLEELEATYVEPNVNGVEERKTKAMKRRQRIKLRYEDMFGVPYANLMMIHEEEMQRWKEEELESNIKGLPESIRPQILAKLAKLKWRYRTGGERPPSPTLRSRKILGTPDNIGAHNAPPPRPRVLKKEEADDPDERDELLYSVRRALTVIDAFNAKKAAKDADRLLFFSNVQMYKSALMDGRQLPPSNSTLKLYKLLMTAEPATRLAARELGAGDDQSDAKRRRPTATSANFRDAILSAKGFISLTGCLRSMLGWTRVLSRVEAGALNPAALTVASNVPRIEAPKLLSRTRVKKTCNTSDAATTALISQLQPSAKRRKGPVVALAVTDEEEEVEEVMIDID